MILLNLWSLKRAHLCWNTSSWAEVCTLSSHVLWRWHLHLFGLCQLHTWSFCGRFNVYFTTSIDQIVPNQSPDLQFPDKARVNWVLYSRNVVNEKKTKRIRFLSPLQITNLLSVLPLKQTWYMGQYVYWSLVSTCFLLHFREQPL